MAEREQARDERGRFAATGSAKLWAEKRGAADVRGITDVPMDTGRAKTWATKAASAQFRPEGRSGHRAGMIETVAKRGGASVEQEVTGEGDQGHRDIATALGKYSIKDGKAAQSAYDSTHSYFQEHPELSTRGASIAPEVRARAAELSARSNDADTRSSITSTATDIHEEIAAHGSLEGVEMLFARDHNTGEVTQTYSKDGRTITIRHERRPTGRVVSLDDHVVSISVAGPKHRDTTTEHDIYSAEEHKEALGRAVKFLHGED